MKREELRPTRRGVITGYVERHNVAWEVGMGVLTAVYVVMAFIEDEVEPGLNPQTIVVLAVAAIREDRGSGPRVPVRTTGWSGRSRGARRLSPRADTDPLLGRVRSRLLDGRARQERRHQRLWGRALPLVPYSDDPGLRRREARD